MVYIWHLQNHTAYILSQQVFSYDTTRSAMFKQSSVYDRVLGINTSNGFKRTPPLRFKVEVISYIKNWRHKITNK